MEASHKKPTTAIDRSQYEKEVILSDCEKHWDQWHDLYTRVLRTGGRDAQLNKQFEPVAEIMDGYLAELFTQNVMLEAIDGIPAPE